MADPIPVDTPAVHQRFAPACFNRAWELLDKKDRTPAEQEELLVVAHASLWHWLQRPEATQENLAVGHWLVSRVSAVVGCRDSALQHAERSLERSRNLSPFSVAYAYEALARAGAMPNSSDNIASVAARDALHRALSLLPRIEDPEERGLLKADLDALDVLIAK